jgi:hypothetical protein
MVVPPVGFENDTAFLLGREEVQEKVRELAWVI